MENGITGCVPVGGQLSTLCDLQHRKGKGFSSSGFRGEGLGPVVLYVYIGAPPTRQGRRGYDDDDSIPHKVVLAYIDVTNTK